MSRPPYRVVQWATGSIGQIAILHVVDNPAFELVGVYVTSEKKVGTDAGEIAAIPATGVLATHDIDAVLALRADCVHYAPLHANVEDLCRILRAGTNVVTPVGFVYPTPSSAADFDALRAACAEGGSSFHGTGVHPGFSGDLLPLIFSRVMTRVEQIQVREVADFRLHPSKAMQQALGFGRDAEDAVANPAPLIRTMDRIFEQSMTMVVEGLGHSVERFTVEFDVARARRDLHVRSGLIPAGTVGGMRFVWTAWVDGRPLVVFRTFWKMDDDLDPDWGYGSIKYSLLIDGDPSLEVNFESAAKHPDGDEGYWGRVWTAMNGVNVIPTVCDAPAGVLTHLDLPLARPRGLARPRSATFGEPVGLPR
ncbi:NAD(P)H-dependent amine dehydrogenase family protein [Frankia sp. AgKG'84/4]|uniref:NAD(P)H-dependent amine dehydrogenase family protein n=1 Tax=Frankia sp. AgKG'84/4 TaxID=573490 RepID=UPI00200CF746|nr:dihydrodipicolinate reductase [Frankia sp. AgKG'84/4]MCL9797239.1 dihydrodipicolinate reductase [Frankia sp. AgKG'84/4]